MVRESSIRRIVLGFNIFFVISGIVLVSIGASVLGVFDKYDEFLGGRFYAIPTFVIITGSLIFIIAFFGCCGAFQQNYCMIMTFCALLVLIFIFELAAGIAGYVLRDDAVGLVHNELTRTMPFYVEKNANVQHMWDFVQYEFDCCGSKSADDWSKVINKESEKNFLPISCCDTYGAIGTVNCTTESETVRVHGCLGALGEYIKSHAATLGAVGITFAIIQFLAIFLGCFVARAVKRNQR